MSSEFWYIKPKNLIVCQGKCFLLKKLLFEALLLTVGFVFDDCYFISIE